MACGGLHPLREALEEAQQPLGEQLLLHGLVAHGLAGPLPATQGAVLLHQKQSRCKALGMRLACVWHVFSMLNALFGGRKMAREQAKRMPKWISWLLSLLGATGGHLAAAAPYERQTAHRLAKLLVGEAFGHASHHLKAEKVRKRAEKAPVTW